MNNYFNTVLFRNEFAVFFYTILVRKRGRAIDKYQKKMVIIAKQFQKEDLEYNITDGYYRAYRINARHFTGYCRRNSNKNTELKMKRQYGK